MVSLSVKLLLAVSLYLSLAGQPALAEGPRIIPVPPGVTPQWTRVPEAPKLYYAPNIPTDVFRYKRTYYFFWNNMWFRGSNVKGPWQPTLQVPSPLKTLDPSYFKTAGPGGAPAEGMPPGPGGAPGAALGPGGPGGRPLPPEVKPWMPPGREGATIAPAGPGGPGLEAQPPGAGPMPPESGQPPEASQPAEPPAADQAPEQPAEPPRRVPKAM